MSYKDKVWKTCLSNIDLIGYGINPNSNKIKKIIKDYKVSFDDDGTIKNIRSNDFLLSDKRIKDYSFENINNKIDSDIIIKM